MSKEHKHRRDDRKKPQLSLKEKRAKKHEKRHPKSVSRPEDLPIE